MILTTANISELPSRYRAHLFQSISGVKSANLLGTIDKQGNTNLSIISSVVHFGSNPPILGYVQRPQTEEKHSLDNIKATKFYSFNVVPANIIAQAHQTSAKYDKLTSEFEATGLTPYFHEKFNAPFVKESQVKIGLELLEIIPIKHNGTQLVLGQVVFVEIPDEHVTKDGVVAHDQLETAGIIGLDTYVKIDKLARFSYAEPTKGLTKL
ncbi:MAG: flavin reductase [Crocinitomicaceae bacterium]|nr:flavin reductase [Crocinitomicaceae bacterium]